MSTKRNFLLFLYLSCRRATSLTPSSVVIRQATRQRHRYLSQRTSSACWSTSQRRRQSYGSDNDEERYYDTRFVGEREEEREFRSIPLQDAPLNRPRQNSLQTEAYPEDEEDWREAESEVSGDSDPVGNFWSNPKGSLDFNPSESHRSRRRRREDMPRATAPPHRRPGRSSGRKSKTTFRSGTPAPPAAMTDLYNRLFWYGFDPAETTSPADRTMFGGTKGKFNGLSYLRDGVGVMPEEARTRRPRERRESQYWDKDEMDDDMNDDDYEYYDGYESEEADRERLQQQVRAQSVTPPYDQPKPTRPRTPLPPSYSSTARQRRRRRRDYYEDDEDEDEDWVSGTVSSWFQGEDDEQPQNYGRQRRKPKSDQSSWAPFGAFEAFFGVRQDRLDDRAAHYDRQMGLGTSQRRPGRRHEPDRPRRKGYAYRYMDDDENPPIADYEVIDAEPVIEAEAEEDDFEEEAPPRPRQGLTWEERALAVERVPPADIPAWGPSGDLGMNARTKAISDALEDINDARRKVKSKEKKVALAKEDLTVLRVDAELEKKRLRQSRQDIRIIREKLRAVDEEIEKAARSLRYAQSQVQAASEELSQLEARHWAVLSFYDPDRAKEEIIDALRELEEAEPAVRRFREKMRSRDTEPSDTDDDLKQHDSDTIEIQNIKDAENE